MKANQAWVGSLLRQKPFHNWVSEKTFHKLKSFFFSRSDGSVATAMKYANKTFQHFYLTIIHPKRMQMGPARRNLNLLTNFMKFRSGKYIQKKLSYTPKVSFIPFVGLTL